MPLGSVLPSVLPEPGGASPDPEESTLTVEFLLDGVWTDMTSLVYGRDLITITRGRSGEGQQTDRSTCRLTVNNRSGDLSPRNPTGAYYGLIGRNTPMRVRVSPASDDGVRFIGEISDWPQRWDVSGRDVYVPLEASGVLRRLSQGSSPLPSTLYRAYTRLATRPRAYWPAEDDQDATQLASALGGPPMTLVGQPDLAANTDFPSSAPVPVLSSSEWTGRVPAYAGTGKVQIWMLVSIPDAGATDGQSILSFDTTGTVVRWSLLYAATGLLSLKGYDNDGAEVEDTGNIDFELNGKPERISVSLEQDGSSIDWQIIGQRLDGGVGGLGGTFTGQTINRVTRVVVNRQGGLGDVGFGHVSVHSEIRDPFDLVDEFIAYSGETAGRRIERLCEQEGISFVSVGDLDETTRMGYQLPNNFVDLLRECEASDGGILYEPRDVLGLAYRTRESMYGQAPALTLDYASNDLSSIEPVDDDQHVRNDITVRRIGGSSFRAVKESGPLSIEAPPDGVGRYDEEVSLSLAVDVQLENQAGWRLHLGTVDEARYPVLRIELARSNFTVDDSAQAIAAQDLDVGDRLVVENPPAWIPPEDITQLAQGFTETIDKFLHTIDINCSPESPWSRVGSYDDAGARYAGSGTTTLNEDLTTTETDVTVAIAGGTIWTHADGDFAIRVGGEVMTVTAVSGASSPQTFTVVRSVNGVVKTHASGAEVQLEDYLVYVM